MDKRDNFNFNNGSALHKESDSNKSFVKKVQSRVTGLLSTSLSKWFGGDDGQKATVRQRDDDEDDETYNPPSKRIKIPTPESKNKYINSFSSNTYTNDLNATTLNYANNAKKLFEPVAGPSGIQSNKHLDSSFSKDNLLNGDKDSESGESIDGNSSRLAFNHANNTINAQRLNRETRNIFNSTSPTASHNRSLFSDRTSTPQLNTSLSSRRPSFNASTFGSPNFVDRTLSTKRILNSPFYKGRTMYGGASAVSAQSRNPGARQTTRNQIQVTPVNKSTCNDASLSETARRILHALEEFRSPLSDAQKVPPPTKRPRPEGILSKYTGANPYIKDHKIPLALNKELQVPTVPDLLKMKLKERLQDSTVAVRQIATTSKSALNKDDYKLRTEDETPKHRNKIKSKISSTRQQKPESQAEEVQLSNISLPITTLPKFEFSLPPPPSSSKQPLITVACNEPPKAPEKAPKKLEETETKTDGDNVQYKFSNPLVLAENLISIIAINDFKFSDPVFKHKDKPTTDVSTNFKSSSDNVQLKRKVPAEAPQPAVKLPKDSVDNKASEKSLDKFKPAPETWECSVCLIRNVPEKLKCAACESPKPQTNQKETSKNSFGNEFKMNAGKWDVNTKVDSINDLKRVESATEKKDNKINGPIIVCNPTTSINHSFGDKFKIPSSMWVCPTCMIQNKNELEKCAACETIKPGSKPTVNSNGFGEAFKKKTSEWECSICMIRNPNEKDACVACETPKPGTKSVAKVQKEENIPTFNFGIFPSTKTSTKTSTATTTTPSVIPTLTTITSSTATSTLSTFTFGIPQKPTSTPVPTAAPEAPKVCQPVDTAEVLTPKVDKPADATPKSNEQALSKPIIVSPPQSAFAFNPTAPVPSIKRTLNDADSTTEVKKDPVASSASSIIFSPPKTDLNPLKPSIFTPQVNLLGQEKNLFGSVAKSQTSIVATTQTPVSTNSSFSFTTPQTLPQVTTTVPANLFSFAAKTTASSLFGNTTTTTQAPLFKFNQPEPTNTPQPSFGVTAETQPQVPMFGKPTTSIFGMTSKPSFETPSSTPAPTFGVTPSGFGTEVKSTIPTRFGGDIKQLPIISGFGSEMKTPTFGSDLKPTAAPPAFGSDLKHPAPPPAFGTEMKPLAPSTFGSTDVKPFTFGARPSEEPSKPVFSFGSTAAKPPEPAKPVSFNFGSTANQPSQPAAPSGGFSFSNNNNNANPAPSFNFSTPKVEAASPFQSPAPAANIFNTPLQTQTQSLQNGGFNFGSTPSSNNNMKTGFNFGATNQFNAAPTAPAPAASGVFSFGSNPNPAPAPATGGFNFGQSAPPASAFNANMKPNFNFTAGNSPGSFSATSENSSMVQRRRLKAVRRSQR